MARSVVCSTVIAIALGGCGGPDEHVPDAARALDAPPGGDYDEPSDFDRSGCVPGSIAFAPPGIVHGFIQFEGFSSTGAWRFDSATLGAIAGWPASRVIVSADDLFLHAVLGDGSSRTLDLCASDAGGTLSGRYARCFEGNCLIGVVEAAHRVDRMAEAAAQGLIRLGGIGAGGEWPPALSVNVRVVAGVAYVARYGDGLRIVDVTDPVAPVDLGHQPVEFPDAKEIYNDVKLVTGPGARRYALMGSNVAGVVVVDVTAPTTPVIVGHLGTPPQGASGINVHTLFVDGGRAYLANSQRGLEIWDVADPTTASKLGEFAINGYLHDLFVRGDRAYLNYWGAGMQVIDVGIPASPQPRGAFANYGETTSHSSWVIDLADGRSIALHGDEQYRAHLRLVDVTEGTPAFLSQVGQWQTRPEVSIHNVMALGTLAVVAHYQDGIRVIELADPSQPQQVAWFNTWPGYASGYGNSFFEGAVGVDVDPVTRRIYVADSHLGLVILQLP